MDQHQSCMPPNNLDIKDLYVTIYILLKYELILYNYNDELPILVFISKSSLFEISNTPTYLFSPRMCVKGGTHSVQDN